MATVAERPFYTERWLREMRRREATFADAAVRPNRAVLRDMLYELFQAAGLTGMRYTVMAMLLDGYSLDEIGAATGTSRPSVHRVKSSALQSIRDYLNATTDVVLVPEMITDLLGNRGVEIIQHCKQGREACAADGICKFRYQQVG